jgi:hypothetical protein
MAIIWACLVLSRLLRGAAVSGAVGATFRGRPRRFGAGSTGGSPVRRPAAGGGLARGVRASLMRNPIGASGSAVGSMPIASSPAGVMRSRTPRPSGSLRQMRFRRRVRLRHAVGDALGDEPAGEQRADHLGGGAAA